MSLGKTQGDSVESKRQNAIVRRASGHPAPASQLFAVPPSVRPPVATPPERAFSTPGARHAKPKRGRSANPFGDLGFQDSNAQQRTNSANPVSSLHPARRAPPRGKGPRGSRPSLRRFVPAFPRFSPPPKKTASNPSLRVWPGKAPKPFPPKGRTNPSPDLERRRDAG